CNFCDSIWVGSNPSPCAATFTYTQTSGSSFNFFGAGSGPGAITNYVWNFGDGSPASSLQSPSHTYAASGYYNVCLTVYGYDSLQNPFTCVYCDSVYAQSGSPSCNASFTMTNTGNTANFTNTSTASGTITNYYWTFGDGGTSTLANPTHAYTNSGYYNVCLNIVAVSSAGTTQCNFCDSIWVGSNPSPCAATFTYTQTSGSSFSFINAASGSGTITNYAWTFGDGGTSTLANPTHNYTTGGIKIVCLTVTGYDSLQNMFSCTYCDSVYAQAGSGCTVNAGYSMSLNYLTANFTNTTTCPTCVNMNYAWTFGDGGTSSQQNPSHTFAISGSYNVCLVVTGYDAQNQTCLDSFCNIILVNPNTISTVDENQALEIYPNPTNGTLNLTLPFTGDTRIKITDMTGQIVWMKQVNVITPQYMLHLESLSTGIYIIQIQHEDKLLHANFSKR
ncbi:MAG TPA: PKD domain-containing protein, partial [Chitinophagaceae bacterium]|nr:PKD domain-containing protein [Chitinophagaceae bacterium]